MSRWPTGVRELSPAHWRQCQSVIESYSRIYFVVGENASVDKFIVYLGICSLSRSCSETVKMG